jgi:hypothetical protein
MELRKSYRLKTILPAILVTGLLFGFSFSPDHSPDKIRKIQLDEIAQPSSTIRLSDIAVEISYVPLETTPDCLFTPSQYIVRGENIYARDRDNGKVFLFNKQGKFLRQIGTIGAGPNEHAGASFMQASPTGDKIYMLSKKTNKLSCYSVQGAQLSTFPVQYACWWFAPLGNDRQIYISPFGYPVPDSAAFRYYLQDSKGKVIRKYPAKRNIPFATGVVEFGSFFVNPLVTMTYQPLCDTVFTLNDKGDFQPRYLLDFGKSRMPDAVWDDKTKYMDVRYDYYNGVSLVETAGSLFVRFYYQKKTRIGLISLGNDNLRGIKSGNGQLENNLDGGPDFWPAETDGKNLVYSFLQPVDLLQKWQNGELKNKKFTSQPGREKFLKMISGITENDNPVLMIVKLRS